MSLASPALAQEAEAAPEESPETSPEGVEEERGGEEVSTETPLEQAPTGEAPTDEAPTDEAPIDEAPIDEAPIDEAPRCHGSGVRGVVRDATTGETLIEAPVIVVGRGTRVMTDVDGRFAIDLAPGTYALRTYYDLYQPTRLDDVVVRRGECHDVVLELDSTATEGEEVVIDVRADASSEASALRARRESATVQDGVSAEEIRRSPDSDAGQAARRIVGATVVGGQYLYVRGLGGRYSTVLLDGAYLPSTDPDTPGVQLDLFPSAMLNGLTVLKTFTPELPGDAAGGTMLISTRQYPSHFQFGATLGIGANSETTFQNGLQGTSGSLDWLGYDDGSRALPSAVRDQVLIADGTAASLERMRSFRSDAWRSGEGLLGPNGRMNLHLGDTLLIGDRRLGYFVSAGYSTSTQRLRGESLTPVFFDVNTGRASPGFTTTRDSTTTTTQLGALGSASLEVSERDQLQLTLLWSQTSESYVGTLTGHDAENDQTTRYTRQRFVARSLYFGQLRGEHRGLPFGARLHWALSGSLSERDEPDTRDVIYGANEGSSSYVYQDDPSSGLRLFLGLRSIELGASGDLSVPVGPAEVRIGGAFRTNERTFAFRRFRSMLDGNYEDLPTSALRQSPDVLFGDEYLGQGTLIQEQTERNDGYFATQMLSAGFVRLDWPLFDAVRLVGGGRIEGFRQTVDPRLPTATTVNLRDAVFRTDLDVLGSAGLIITLPSDMVLRASYGTTVARPQIRELAPFLYPDFIRQRNIYGEPTLQRTRIDNVDLRWELYLSPSELLAASVFYKHFESPIEMVALGNSTFSYRNVQSGVNVGGELEARFGLSRITPALSWFDIGANLTLVYSQVELSAEQAVSSTSRQRPLAGQSPYVVNVSVGAQVPDANLTVRVLYNVFGERLVEVGVMGTPDVYQLPFHSLDLTATWAFEREWELRAAVENILLDDYVLSQGPAIAQQYNAGLSASLALSFRPH